MSFLVHAAKLTNGNLGIDLTEAQENSGPQLLHTQPEPQPTRAPALSLLASNLRPEALLPIVVPAVPFAASTAYTPPPTEPVQDRSRLLRTCCAVAELAVRVTGARTDERTTLDPTCA